MDDYVRLALGQHLDALKKQLEWAEESVADLQGCLMRATQEANRLRPQIDSVEAALDQ